MKCFYHEERDAVATCQKCGKSLCKECASKYKPIICEDCFREVQEKEEAEQAYRLSCHRKETINKAIHSVIITLIVQGMLTFFLSLSHYIYSYSFSASLIFYNFKSVLCVTFPLIIWVIIRIKKVIEFPKE